MIALRTADRLDPHESAGRLRNRPPVAETEPRETPPRRSRSTPSRRRSGARCLREIDLHHGNISRVAQRLSIGRKHSTVNAPLGILSRSDLSAPRLGNCLARRRRVVVGAAMERSTRGRRRSRGRRYPGRVAYQSL